MANDRNMYFFSEKYFLKTQTQETTRNDTYIAATHLKQ